MKRILFAATLLASGCVCDPFAVEYREAIVMPSRPAPAPAQTPPPPVAKDVPRIVPGSIRINGQEPAKDAPAQGPAIAPERQG